jgi:transcriptional regulator with XRE-family HTH domain
VNRPPDLGRRLRAAREYKGLSQGALANALTGVSQSSVARYENGELPDDRKLAALLDDWAEVCDVPTGWFTTPWGQNPVDQTHPDEPEWVGRLENHLTLILGVLRARSDQTAEAGLEQLAAPDVDRRSRDRRSG